MEAAMKGAMLKFANKIATSPYKMMVSVQGA
jgi:hypothetical protein